MPYPTPSEYQEALQFPQTAFADPALAEGEPATNALGLPQPITGAFAVVFPVETAGGRFAVRCFLAPAEDLRARYRAIARTLAEADLPYTVPFEVQPEGVRVGGRAFPLLKMAWAEGEGLAAWAERHRREPERLRALAAAWRRMLADLEAAGIAHGDLQHGNVLVHEEDGEPRLRLVDYDTMFVPSLRGRPSAEVGHRNYQHPDRTERDFGPRLDRFSGLVVYTALLALAERPSLWERYSTGENLLFQAGDFHAPRDSPLFAELGEMEAVRPLAEALARACYLEPEAAPSLEAVERGEVEAARPRRRRERREARTGRSGLEAAFVPAAAGGAALAVAVGVGASPWLGILMAVMATVAMGVAAARGYRRRPAVRRRRRIAREAAVLDRWIAELEDARQTLVRDRADFLRNLEAFRAERLREIQDEALQRRLRHHFTGELAEVEEVGHRAVIRLKAVGIRNAFHATPERVAEARGLRPEAVEAVTRWREGLAARYAAEVPEALSPAEEQRLRRQLERRLDRTDDELARLAARTDVQREERAQVRAQEEALPELTPWIYFLYLLRLRALPEAPAAAPGRPILQRPAEAPARRPPLQRPKPEERPWWEQA